MHSDDSELQNAVSGRESELGSQPTAVRRQRPPDFAKIRRDYPNSYKAWDKEEEFLLSRLVEEGQTVSEIARRLQRNPSAIRSKMRQKLNENRDYP